MATIQPIESITDSKRGNRYRLITWRDVTPADEVQAYSLLAMDLECMAVQVEGDFAGGECAIEGCIDGKTYRPLADASGITIKRRSAGISALSAPVADIRPAVSDQAGLKLTISVLTRGSL